jgi:hypothetical protein
MYEITTGGQFVIYALEKDRKSQTHFGDDFLFLSVAKKMKGKD